MIWWHRCSIHGKREGNTAGGRVAAAHVGWLLCVLCVLCVVCYVLWLCFVFCNIAMYHTGSKTILAKSKWPTFAPSFHNICA
jgi:hypothetical protein